MLEWVTVAGTALKTASGVLKDLRSMKIDAAVMEKAIELNSLILDLQEQFMAAQAERAAMADEIRRLKGELEAKEDWLKEKQQYRYHKFETESVALVSVTEGDSPTRFFCASCFENKQVRTLQPCQIKAGDGLKCPHCKTEILIKPFKMSIYSF